MSIAVKTLITPRLLIMSLEPQHNNTFIKMDTIPAKKKHPKSQPYLDPYVHFKPTPPCLNVLPQQYCSQPNAVHGRLPKHLSPSDHPPSPHPSLPPAPSQNTPEPGTWKHTISSSSESNSVPSTWHHLLTPYMHLPKLVKCRHLPCQSSLLVFWLCP